MNNSPSGDLEKTVEELINDIDVINKECTSGTNPKANAIALNTVIGKFACILTKLSREAARQTTAVIRLTWGLFGLTVILLTISIAQLALMIKGK
jgi:hypothetical protein